MNEETKCPHQPAITTRYLPATDVYPPRISATEYMGLTITVPIELDENNECGFELHVDAARRLCNVLELKGWLICDYINKYTMAFVWDDVDDLLKFKI